MISTYNFVCVFFKALFLIGLGIEEEKKCVAKGSTSFSFVSKATNGNVIISDSSLFECKLPR